MNTIKFPAQRSDGTFVSLSDVLAVVPENRYLWMLKRYWGVGVVPHDLPIERFSAMTMTSEGVRFDWRQLLEFAAGLDQIIDGDIWAFEEGEEAAPKIFIEVFDSGQWTIEWDESLILQAGFQVVAEGNLPAIWSNPSS
jgi:hypothetical protein